MIHWQDLKYKHNICKQYDCTPKQCLCATEKHCHGEYWEERCMFYEVHLAVNCGKILEDVK